MFSNVKSQIDDIGGWLSSNIPKLLQTDGQQEQEETQEHHLLTEEGKTSVSAEFTKISSQPNSDDNCNVTGRAGSAPPSIQETPTEENYSHFRNVRSKALAGAKLFGNFVCSAVNKAGKTVSEVGTKLKQTVEENSMLDEFNKEHEYFLKAQQGINTASALSPWAGCANEEVLKEECLSLSTDKRNFVRNLPEGVSFHFDYNVSYPVAIAIMEQDLNLVKMRFKLVPKVITEENFWRNYFYRVSLICQANEVSFMSRQCDRQSVTKSVICDQPTKVKSASPLEFVSDSLQASSQDLVEVQEGMKNLTSGSKYQEEDWEKELADELQDYEVVTENISIDSKNKSNCQQEM